MQRPVASTSTAIVIAILLSGCIVVAAPTGEVAAPAGPSQGDRSACASRSALRAALDNSSPAGISSDLAQRAVVASNQSATADTFSVVAAFDNLANVMAYGSDEVTLTGQTTAATILKLTQAFDQVDEACGYLGL